jgi:tRNA G26 N,N-dimethylase Trm1
MDKLAKSGAKATMTQFDENGFKTDADSSLVLKVVRNLA